MANGVGADDILGLFHHIHHINGEHKVHHCGGAHIEVDPTVNYTIQHCSCGKHSIDKQRAIGHGADSTFFKTPISVVFTDECPKGGWHVESGVPDVNIEFHSANPPA
ncbi:MAG: hypothetical protein AAB886_00370 [Patescibacteria group bacterium]